MHVSSCVAPVAGVLPRVTVYFVHIHPLHTLHTQHTHTHTYAPATCNSVLWMSSLNLCATSFSLIRFRLAYLPRVTVYFG